MNAGQEFLDSLFYGSNSYLQQQFHLIETDIDLIEIKSINPVCPFQYRHPALHLYKLVRISFQKHTSPTNQSVLFKNGAISVNCEYVI